MSEPNIPTTATKPDFGQLRQSHQGFQEPERTLDNTLDEALPDNSQNPTLKALKSLVRAFMSKKDQHGLTMVPNTWQAMLGVSEATNANPKLANQEFVKSLTNTVQHNGELSLDTNGIMYARAGNPDDGFPHGRQGAVRALGTIMDKRPDLADAALVKDMSNIATNDPDSGVRVQAQNVLGKISDKRSDLINHDMLKATSQAANSPISNHGDNDGFVAKREGLVGWNFDRDVNEARSTAQHTLQIIKQKHPEFFNDVKLAVVQKQSNGSPHIQASHQQNRSLIVP